MTFTYDGTPNTDLEKVRFYIQDVTAADPLFTDEEINVVLGVFANNIAATCTAMCDAAVAKFARQVDFTMDGQNVKLSQKVKHYQDLGDRFRADPTNSITAFGTGFITKIDGYQPTTPGYEKDADDRLTATIHNADERDFETGQV